MEDWPFAEPKNLAVITVRQIVVDGQPVLHVTHDSDDHGWQFLGWETPEEEDAMVVCLEEIVSSDGSLRELADLPIGWHAYRQSPAEPWVREPNPDEPA